MNTEKIQKMLRNEIKYKKVKLDEKKAEKYSSEYITLLNSTYEKNGYAFRINNEGHLICGSSTICSFYIILRADILIEGFAETKNLMLLEIVSIEKEEIHRIIIDKGEYEDVNWIWKNLLKDNYKYNNNYRLLRQAIEISKNTILYSTMHTTEYSGWGLVYEKKGMSRKWEYIVSKQCNLWRSRSIDGSCTFYTEAKIFEESLNFLNAEPRNVIVPVFSYCLLALLNGLFRDADIEPNFILQLNGHPKTYVMQIAELFSSNMNPEKAVVFYHQQHLEDFYEDNCDAGYLENGYYSNSTEGYGVIKEMLESFKDKTIIIDGIMKSSTMSPKVLERLLNKYYIKNKLIEEEKRKLNALPIVVREDAIENNYYLNVSMEGKSIEPQELVKLRIKEYFLTAMVLDFVEWLEECLNSDNRLLYILKQDFQGYKKSIYYSIAEFGERKSEEYAWLLLACELYLKYGLFNEFISKVEYEKYRDRLSESLIGIRYDELLLTTNVDERLATINSKKKTRLIEVLRAIDCIYNDNELRFSEEKRSLKGNEIGWKIYVSNEALICFKEDAFINCIKGFIKDESTRRDSTLTYDSIKQSMRDNEIIKENSSNPYLLKIVNGSWTDRVIAIRIEKLREYLNNSRPASKKTN